MLLAMHATHKTPLLHKCWAGVLVRSVPTRRESPGVGGSTAVTPAQHNCGNPPHKQ